jgi:hypothetical protein
VVFSLEPAPIHARIEALEQLNRDIRLLVPDQAWRRDQAGRSDHDIVDRLEELAARAVVPLVPKREAGR